MAKIGNKNNKARCERYKSQGRRALNKVKKQEKHKKLMDKFAKRRELGKTYEYKANPFPKDSKEYILESNKRANKNVDRMLPLSRFDSVMRHAGNYALKQKAESKRNKDKKVKENSEEKKVS